MKKKWRETLRLLESVEGLSEHERILFAKSLSQSPDERWESHQRFLRSYGLYKRSERKAYGFK